MGKPGPVWRLFCLFVYLLFFKFGRKLYQICVTPLVARTNLPNPDLSGLEKFKDGIAIQTSITEVTADSTQSLMRVWWLRD